MNKPRPRVTPQMSLNVPSIVPSNRFDHFRTDIDGLKIRFLYQRSKEEGAVPLIVIHGWPSSFAEFTKIVGPLTDPVAHGGRAEDAFHVICPSLPGYGFSEAPR